MWFSYVNWGSRHSGREDDDDDDDDDDDEDDDDVDDVDDVDDEDDDDDDDNDDDDEEDEEKKDIYTKNLTTPTEVWGKRRKGGHRIRRAFGPERVR